MSTLTQFTGFREIPLIPDASEPAFCTSGYGQNPIYLFNHSCQLIGQFAWQSGEFAANSAYFNINWNGTPSSTNGWNYAGTTLTGPHGHLFTSATPSVDSNSQTYGNIYLNSNASSAGQYLGVLNSQMTGVWVGKTKRDNLCIQRVNNGSAYTSYNYATQVTMLGYGANYAPIVSTQNLTGGTTTGTTNGYNTNGSYGLVGYNETLKWWVDIPNASASTATMFVYKGINPPTLANCNNQTFFNQFSTATKLTVNFNFPAYSETRDYQHYKIFPLDNGNIALIYKNAQTSINYQLFTGNNGVNSTSWTLSSVYSLSTTTSYHNSNFTQQDSLPALVSYDGRYVFIWTQYYYYQTGMSGFAIRVSDGAMRYFQFTTNSFAVTPVFTNANELLLCYGQNSDGGTGTYLYQYDLDYSFSSGANNSDGTSIYVGLPSINNPYTSTNYPMIWTAQSYLPNFIRGVF